MIGRLVLLALAAVACLTVAMPAQAGSAQCPDVSYVQVGGLVFAGEPVPAGVTLTPGRELGAGEINRPRGTDPCEREQVELAVFAIEGVDPGTAVLAEGVTGEGFILGGRCTGLAAGAGRWDCILAPLEHDGTTYTALAYPAGENPRAEVALADELGRSTLGGEQVTVRAIVGVDPAVAVGVEGRPHEAFVAPGVCPYERFAADPLRDDLTTCLESPLWLVFEPLGAEPGERVEATGDRVAVAQLDGAPVSLLRLAGDSDTLPETIGETTPIGTLALDAGGLTGLTFEVADLPAGLYEAVVECDACASSFGGRTTFAAGSIVVLEGGDGGSRSAKIFYIAVFSLLFLAIIAAIVLWIRGARPRFRRRTM